MSLHENDGISSVRWFVRLLDDQKAHAFTQQHQYSSKGKPIKKRWPYINALDQTDSPSFLSSLHFPQLSLFLSFFWPILSYPPTHTMTDIKPTTLNDNASLSVPIHHSKHVRVNQTQCMQCNLIMDPSTANHQPYAFATDSFNVLQCVFFLHIS